MTVQLLRLSVLLALDRVNVFHLRQAPALPLPPDPADKVLHVLPDLLLRRLLGVCQRQALILAREVRIHQQLQAELCPLGVVLPDPVRRQVLLCRPGLPALLPSPCREDLRDQRVPGHGRHCTITHLADAEVTAFPLPPVRILHGHLQRGRALHIEQCRIFPHDRNSSLYGQGTRGPQRVDRHPGPSGDLVSPDTPFASVTIIIF